VEAGPGEVEPLLGAREEIASALRDLGFARVTVDPRGYRGRIL
jgi:PP-loop superfamily ATP-utilizing enzyme